MATHAGSPKLYAASGTAGRNSAWLRVDVEEPTLASAVRAALAGAALVESSGDPTAAAALVEQWTEALRGCAADELLDHVSRLARELRSDHWTSRIQEDKNEDKKHDKDKSGKDSKVRAAVGRGVALATEAARRVSVGARVWVSMVDDAARRATDTGADHYFGGDGVQMREVGAGPAFMGQSEATAHFGLGPWGHTVRLVSVHWPHLDASRTLWSVPSRDRLRVTPPLSAVARLGARLLADTCEAAYPTSLRRAVARLLRSPASGAPSLLESASEPAHAAWWVDVRHVGALTPCEDLRIDAIIAQPAVGRAAVRFGRFIDFFPPSDDAFRAAGRPQVVSIAYRAVDAQGHVHEQEIEIRLDS
jgi:hypothetical protein